MKKHGLFTVYSVVKKLTLLKDKILDLSKWRAFVDDKLEMDDAVDLALIG